MFISSYYLSCQTFFLYELDDLKLDKYFLNSKKGRSIGESNKVIGMGIDFSLHHYKGRIKRVSSLISLQRCVSLIINWCCL